MSESNQAELQHAAKAVADKLFGENAATTIERETVHRIATQMLDNPALLAEFERMFSQSEAFKLNARQGEASASTGWEGVQPDLITPARAAAGAAAGAAALAAGPAGAAAVVAA